MMSKAETEVIMVLTEEAGEGVHQRVSLEAGSEEEEVVQQMELELVSLIIKTLDLMTQERTNNGACAKDNSHRGPRQFNARNDQARHKAKKYSLYIMHLNFS